MPINIDKVIKDITINKPKTSYSAKYFQSSLTGSGKKMGLLNNHTDTIKNNRLQKNLKYNTNNRFEINFSQVDHRVVFDTINPNVVKYNFANNLPSKLNKQHTYDTSLLSLLLNFKDDPYLLLRNHLLFHKFSTLPFFLKDLHWSVLADNDHYQVKISMIIDRIKYSDHRQLDDQNKLTKTHYETYALSLNPVIQIINKNANTNKTNVKILSCNDEQQTYFNQFAKHNQLTILTDYNPYVLSESLTYPSHQSIIIDSFKDLIQQINDITNSDITIQDIQNELEQISISHTLKNQAKLHAKFFFHDFSSIFKLINTKKLAVDGMPDLNHDFLNKIYQSIMANSYHLIKLVDSNADEQNYDILYNRLRTTILKHDTHKVSKLTQYDFDQFIALNTRLSLSHQLLTLKNDTKVYQFKPTQKSLTTKDQYSPEQLKIIYTTKPYVVGVAGAGSGKSHTLLGRLDYLKQNHVDFHHVLVTTFTNVAANNIINRFHDGINSLTNASLFNEIYQCNFQHELTNDLTLANFLDTMSANSPFMQSNKTLNNTREQLIEILSSSVPTGFKQVDVLHCIELLTHLALTRFDDIIKLLNVTKKTTLLLEPVIINAMMQHHTIKYPESLKDLNFILTDESQDTSSFEYILLLELAHQNHAQLMIIGDANQTLYQFRDANPEFMNALERSHTFTTYTMNTNYRSNQAVLAMANQLLSVMTTNQTAKIQLQANQYLNLNQNIFKDHVKMSNIMLTDDRQNMHNASLGKDQVLLYNAITEDNNAVSWILNEYNSRHQIAILTYRNRDTQAIGKAVKDIIATNTGTEPTLGYTRNPSQRPNTYLSRTLNTNDYGLRNSIKKAGYASAKMIQTNLLNRLRSITPATVPVNQWAQKQIINLTHSGILQRYVQDFNHHQAGFGSLNYIIISGLINAETKHNAIANQIQNRDRNDWQDKDIVVSTIHSAKGLEFDSVLCYFDETRRNAASQANLRLYGVALTRAKNNELILNQPTTTNSQGRIQPSSFGTQPRNIYTTPMRTSYQRVLNALK